MWMLQSLKLMKSRISVYLGESKVSVIFYDNTHKMMEEYYRHVSNLSVSYIGGNTKKLCFNDLETIIHEFIRRGIEVIFFYKLSDKKVRDNSVYISTTQGNCGHHIIEKMMGEKIHVYPNTENLIENNIVSEITKNFIDWRLNLVVGEGGRKGEGTFCKILQFFNIYEF